MNFTKCASYELIVNIVLGALQRAITRRMEFWVWICDPKLDEHVAEFDRGGAGEPDDARQRVDGERGDRDHVLRRGVDGQHQQSETPLCLIYIFIHF